MKEIEIAAYLDRRLSATERSRIEEHLADCADCRREIDEGGKLLRKVRRPRRMMAGGAAIAAAALAVILAKPFQTSMNGERPDALRGNASAPILVAYAPIGSVSAARLHFVWASAPQAASYRFTLRRDGATPIWSQSTVDTTLTPPASVPFRIGEQYSWLVDAVLIDGTTISTTTREFRIVP